LFAAQVWLAASTDGIAANYGGFFALAIIYVGLTQQRILVPMAVAVAAPCWLICQEEITVATVFRLATAITFWLLGGLALASRAEIDRARTAELLDRANTDPLTGLASRLCLADQIHREINERDRTESTVMVIDLDGFKGVNDEHGHRVGDLVLEQVASRLTAVLRPRDVVARLGGDEFAVLCPELADDESAVHIAERVVVSLQRPFLVDDASITIGASVGIATAEPGDLGADELLDSADRALYQAKGQGRGRWYLGSAPAG
jgi:diguanylate cyclase (GGDEF)-like protein